MAVTVPRSAKDRQHSEWQSVLVDAYQMGLEAVVVAKVVPMVVGTPRDMAASLLGGDDGGFDPNHPIYHVPDGVCGFAWVNVKGDRKFLNWLNGTGDSKFTALTALRQDMWEHGDRTSVLSPAKTDRYYKGVSVWVGGFGQSMQRKEAFGHAFAKVLNERVEGISAYCMSRMD